jgi:acyl carrier protein
MNDDLILRTVNEVFRDVLDNDDLVIGPATTARDVREWDSLSHIQLVRAVEKRFQVHFTAAQIQTFKNVGDMCAAIAKKLRPG